MKYSVIFDTEEQLHEFLVWKKSRNASKSYAFTPSTGDSDALGKTRIESVISDCRAINCLRFDGFETLSDVERVPDNTLLKIPNFGRKSLKRVRFDCERYRREAA